MSSDELEEFAKAIRECTYYTMDVKGNVITLAKGRDFLLKWERHIVILFTILVSLLPLYVLVKYILVNKRFDYIVFMFATFVYLPAALVLMVAKDGLWITGSRRIMIDRNKETLQINESPKTYLIQFKAIKSLMVVNRGVYRKIYYVACDADGKYYPRKDYALFDVRNCWSVRGEKQYAERVCSALRPILKCWA